MLKLPDGDLVCVTPNHTDELDAEGCFAFRVDPAFMFDGAYMRRKGEFLPQRSSIIRREPEAVRHQYAELLGRIEAGELTCNEALHHLEHA